MHLRTSVSLVLLVAFAPRLTSAEPGKLLIDLDVPAEKVPGRLCVITDHTSCARGNKNQCESLDLHDLILEKLEAKGPEWAAAVAYRELATRDPSSAVSDTLRSAAATRSWFLPWVRSKTLAGIVLLRSAIPWARRSPRRNSVFALRGISTTATRWQDAVVEVVNELTARPPVTDCDKLHSMCQPTLYLSDDWLKKGSITCGGTGATDNVAILSLEYRNAEGSKPGIREIQLVGNQASLSFNGELDREALTFVQVVGGDYSPSLRSSPGSSAHAQIELHPRCSRAIAEIPGYKADIGNVSLLSDSSDPQHSGWCAARQRERTLAIEVPYSAEAERKTLEVTYTTDPETSSDATWTTPLPPVPLRLGIRSFEFRWRRPTGCAAERWEGESGSRQPSVRRWSVSCPRATLPEGSICMLRSSSPEACDYWCSVDRNIGSLSPPIPVHFDRMRRHAGETSDVVIYSWDDQVRFSGQELVSSVAPENRRVLLEYRNPHKWTDRLGIKIDEIRLFTSIGAADRLKLTGRADGDVPPDWTALSTPGTCLDDAFIGLAVFGTHPYVEQSVRVSGGVVTLEDPPAYRSRLHYHVSVGSGTQPEQWLAQARVYGELGFGVSYDLDSPFTINLDFAGQLTHKSYDTIPLFTKSRTRENVGYRRLELHANVEYWWRRDVHTFAALGVGGGSALDSAGDKRVGGRCLGSTESCSVTTDTGAMINLVRRQLWLVILVGARFGERYTAFTTDYIGEPTPNFTGSVLPYLELKLQWRIH